MMQQLLATTLAFLAGLLAVALIMAIGVGVGYRFAKRDAARECDDRIEEVLVEMPGVD